MNSPKKDNNDFDIPENDKQLSPRLSYFSDTGAGILCKDILENWGKQVWPKPENAVTEMDIFSIQWFSDREIHHSYEIKLELTLILKKEKTRYKNSIEEL